MTATEPTTNTGPNRARFAVDLLERTLATAAQGALGELAVQLADLPQWALVPIVAALAVAKGWLARFVGPSSSASLAPRV